MKKQINSISPFIMLVLPVFFAIAVYFWNSKAELSTERYKASTGFQLPALKNVIKTMF